MGIRFQPPVVEIPTGNPFENDLLDRKEQAEVLTHVVRNVDGPCAIAVDAAWGAGKTTFLKMWADFLRDEGFPVVEFNAWETDYTENPFVALSSEITEGIEKWSGPPANAQFDSVKRNSLDILRRAAPGVIRLTTGFIPVAGGEIGNVLSSLAEEKLSGYMQAQQSISEFKSELQRLASALWESTGHKPLVVLIDELDRCRPSYAIELLETGKHIFSADRVVFVIAVNRSELAKSVKVLYGDDFDADGYLRRFFDVEFRMPEPDRDAFIRYMLESSGFYEYLGRTEDRFAIRDAGFLLTVLQRFLGESEISLREVGQAIHRFGLVTSSLADHELGYSLTLAVLTILMTVNHSLYRRFVNGEMTDQEVVGELFRHPGYQALRRTREGYVVEAVLIAARVTELDIRYGDEHLRNVAPLFFEYHSLSRPVSPGENGQEEARTHALAITDLVLDFHRARGPVRRTLGFRESVQRLELLSNDLMDNR